MQVYLNASIFANKNLTYDSLEKYLKKHKKKINLSDFAGKIPLTVICEKNPKLELIKLMVEYGADVNRLDKYDMNCLFHVFLNKIFDPNIVDYIVSQGCTMLQQNEKGLTILHTIICERAFTQEKLQTIMKFAPELINTIGRYKSPLMYMCQHYPNLEYIKMLIDAGADINYSSFDANCLDFLSLDRIKTSSLNEIVMYFISKQLKINDKALINIIETGKLDINTFKSILTPDKINAKIHFDDTMLHVYLKTVRNIKVGIIKFFIESGFDPTMIDNFGVNCLFHLFDKVNVSNKMVKLFVDKGCNFEQKDIDGNTILHLIARNVSLSGIKILKQYKKDLVGEKNKKGDTPLMILSNLSINTIEHIKKIIELGYIPTEEEKEICLFNSILRYHDIDENSEKNMKHLIEIGFKFIENGSEHIPKYQVFSDLCENFFTIRKKLFLAKHNLPLGTKKFIKNELEYLGFKSKFYLFTSNQLYY